jgi:hypothetical protein
MMPFLEEPPHHAKHYVHLADRVALVLTSLGAGLIILTTLFVLALYGLGILH